MKDDVYTREWFQAHYQLRDEYRAVADVLLDVFFDDRPHRMIVDVGCGAALLLERLRERQALAWGVDGAQAAFDTAPADVRPFLELVDLTQPFPPERDRHWPFYFELVICTEVAEHLEAEHAEVLVDHVVGRRTEFGHVFFTAATPGQGGTDHVNEQPHEYWIEKFRRRGLTLDRMRTDFIRGELADKCPSMAWFGRNSLVFR